MILPENETIFTSFTDDSILSVHRFDFFCLRYEVMYPYSTHSYESTQKLDLLQRKIVKYSIETSSRCCFCSIMSTNLLTFFSCLKFSVSMQCAVLFEISTMSASSCTFTWRSPNIILWTFFTISGVVTSFGQPLRR